MPVATPAKQEPQNNPALNQQAFARAIERNGGAERTGMSAIGTYVKTGLLLLLLIAAGTWGWSQVQFETIRGTVVAIPPNWIWFAFFFTFILAIAGIFAV